MQILVCEQRETREKAGEPTPPAPPKPVAWKNVAVLRGIAICMVVLNHATGKAFGIASLQGYEISPQVAPVAFGVEVFLRNVTPFCLPAFFFASGFTLYPMHRGWKSSSRAAWQIARKYLIWAVPMTLLLSRNLVEAGLSGFVVRILQGSPFTAYWFLVVITELYLLSPILVWLVKKHPGLALTLSVGIMLFDSALLYCRVDWDAAGPFITHVFKIVMHMPGFVLGMLCASRLPGVMAFVTGHRKLLAALAVAALALLHIESSVWFRFQGFDEWRAFAGERLGLKAFSLTVLALLLGCPSRQTALRTWFVKIGLASLGILLMVDGFQRVAYVLFWHVPERLGVTTDAWWGHSAWLTLPIFFVVGLWGPLLAMRWAVRLLGPRMRMLW